MLNPVDSAALASLANRMPMPSPSPFPNPFEPVQFQQSHQLLPTRPSSDALHLTVDTSNADAIDAVIQKVRGSPEGRR